MLPNPQLNQDWTVQDEEQLKHEWLNNPMGPYMLDNGGNRHIAPLWRCLYI